MIHKTRNTLSAGLTLVALILTVTALTANAQKQTTRNAHVAPVQLPIYSEYRGVRIGMTATEVRAKLGEPVQKADDGDFYAFSEKETAQIAYNAAHIVMTVSVDYIGGVSAPDYKAVVGSDAEVKPDGSIYKLVRYDALGLWVYYNRTAGDAPIVTITLQKSLDR